MKEITIHTDYITLGQFFKLADCISSGGQTKVFLQETGVKVNGEPENRRGRKIYPGFYVEISGCGSFNCTRQETL